MLKIQQAQMQALQKSALERFEDEMVEHATEFAPPLCDLLGPEQVRIAVRAILSKADGFGFTHRGPMRLLVEMMLLFGSGFDSDPQYPWIAEMLDAKEDQMLRAERLCQKIDDYQTKTAGDDSHLLTASLERMRACGNGQLTMGAGGVEEGALLLLEKIHPEKAAYLGEIPMRNLIFRARAMAREHQFQQPREEALIILMMSGFGHVCAEDPLYPWIGQTLADTRIKGPAAKAERLEKKVMTWLDHALEALKKGN